MSRCFTDPKAGSSPAFLFVSFHALLEQLETLLPVEQHQKRNFQHKIRAECALIETNQAKQHWAVVARPAGADKTADLMMTRNMSQPVMLP